MNITELFTGIYILMVFMPFAAMLYFLVFSGKVYYAEASLMCFVIAIENCGYMIIAYSSSLGEAIAADKFTLIGGLLLPFLMVMLIYMMVILYGQSMANSVMLEKTSKLMETILTAVHPFALMAGKLLATATAAVIQILVWLASLIGGTVGGAMLALRFIAKPGAAAKKVSGGEVTWRDLAALEKNARPLGQPGWHAGYDEEAKAAYLWNDDSSSKDFGMFYSYESSRSLSDKLTYIRVHCLGGIVVWESGGDSAKDDWPMIRQMHASLQP